MAPSVSVSQFYAGKKIFITGSTGFMGKVLVEKLLRCCPDIAKIYLLMRGKKGQSSRERLEDFIHSMVFDRIREDDPRIFEKLQLVAGDILKDELDMASSDRELLAAETQVVFHCAACVRFDQCLKDAVALNTQGTQRVLKLAEDMKKLEIFLHVSTAYCRCELPVLEEKLYPTHHDPQDIINCCRWMDDGLLGHLESKLIEPQPNTYAYTKALTEDLVKTYEGQFPIAIARPSIVTAALHEPFPGWIDNMNGPTGLLVGAGKGVIRSMLVRGDYQADIIPVDLVVNGCILLAYTAALQKSDKIQVCNMTNSRTNPVTWHTAIELGREQVGVYPFNVALWYPGGSIKSSTLSHNVADFFTHLLPALFIDLILYLLGKKTFMMRIYRKIQNGMGVLMYYTTKEWYFQNDNFTALQNEVSKEDKQTFYIDLKLIQWRRYICEYIRGAREFCCKDDPASLQQARKLHRQLYYLDRITKLLFIVLVVYVVYQYSKRNL